MAAEKRFEWIMKIILSRDGDGPFGIVEDYVWKRNTKSVVPFTGTCCCGVNLEPFPKIALWLNFPRSSNTKDPRLLTCVKLCIKCNAIVAVYQRDV